MKIVKTEEWEESYINALTLKLIMAATLGTLAATGIAFILKKAGVPEIQPELLFIPWSIALVVGTALSFHRGVMAERARAAKAAEEKK